MRSHASTEAMEMPNTCRGRVRAHRGPRRCLPSKALSLSAGAGRGLQLRELRQEGVGASRRRVDGGASRRSRSRGRRRTSTARWWATSGLIVGWYAPGRGGRATRAHAQDLPRGRAHARPHRATRVPRLGVPRARPLPGQGRRLRQDEPLRGGHAIPNAGWYQILAFMASLEVYRVNKLKDPRTCRATCPRPGPEPLPFGFDYTPEEYAEKQPGISTVACDARHHRPRGRRRARATSASSPCSAAASPSS